VAFGMFSLIVWTLNITTSVKYVALVMRADSDGEAGILALMARLALKGKSRPGLVVLGMLGAALLLAFDAIFVNLSFLQLFN
jgi:KUP system potassium uptake protein